MPSSPPPFTTPPARHRCIKRCTLSINGVDIPAISKPTYLRCHHAFNFTVLLVPSNSSTPSSTLTSSPSSTTSSSTSLLCPPVRTSRSYLPSSSPSERLHETA